ncbi:MAG: AraC family transcriptional regulator [Pseudomonadales bacterium]|nr:AraC family transcriptional regulator [Pseudomonadales bacterium]
MQREPVHRAAGQSAAITDGALRAGPLTAVPSLLRELGQDPEAVFAALGCSPQLLENSENAIPFTLLGRLFDTCTIATGCPHFGLLLGQRMGLDCVGLVGMVARHSPTVKEALSNLLLYMHLHDRGAVPTLAVVDEEAVFGYTIYQPGMTTTASVYDACAAIACNALGTLCGPRWRPTGAQLPRSRPDDPEPYRRVFGLTPTFAAERMALTFAADWLERPVPGADPALYRVLREQAEVLAVGANDNVVPRVRRIACNLLLCGSGSLDSAAALLSMHPRTLRRRLHASGITYRQLCEECREALALQLLHDSSLPIGEIAARLQYANTAAFTRAFRRWTGSTPTTWRAGQAGYPPRLETPALPSLS